MAKNTEVNRASCRRYYQKHKKELAEKRKRKYAESQEFRDKLKIIKVRYYLKKLNSPLADKM